MGFYGRKQVLELSSLSNATLWRRIKAGDFPKPVRLSPGRVGWSREAVHRWLAEKTQQEAA